MSNVKYVQFQVLGGMMNVTASTSKPVTTTEMPTTSATSTTIEPDDINETVK